MNEKVLTYSLKEKIYSNLQFIKENKCILMKYPGHMNGGDGLIWLGGLKLFKDFNIKLTMQLPDCRIDRYLIDSLDYETILIQGGGNFGDIWPDYNEFHLSIINNNRNKKIIQLPVTIQFNDPNKLNDIKKAIDSHPSFVLTVRDNNSYEFAKENFNCEVILLPDLALYLEPKDLSDSLNPVKNKKNDEVLYVLRSDKESSIIKKEKLMGKSKDWLDFQPKIFLLKEDLFLKIFFRNYFKLLPELFEKLDMTIMLKNSCYDIMIEHHKHKFKKEIKNVADVLGKYNIVVTDRLHIHILCTILRKSNILLLNSYHKNLSFYNTWTKDDPISEICTDLRDLDLKINKLLAK